ncbi:glycosyltransferase family 4 protein [Robertkochia aurantiaca]|uniref:glycosyltransferase family 4 protein n=1 Tax=Robertkochia aurantiaca TaxID=2873700 RepID=UPI001CCB360C|nr:glycosyltransferase family 4 protein [Robertkochia sp. 3YJGBD-33]
MKKLLIIGHRWPDPTASAAGSRMLQLIKALQQGGYEITFSTTETDSPFREKLLNVGVKSQTISVNDDGFDVWVRSLNPDVVVFDRFMMEEQFGWRVAEQIPEAMRILDTEDLHFLRDLRRREVMNLHPYSLKPLSELAKRELASILRCDLSLIISEKEMELLTTELNIDGKHLHYIPIVFDKARSPGNIPGFSARSDFMFIGNFKHAPNVDALQQLKTIWPKIRKQLPKASLNVYGAYAGDKIMSLNDNAGGLKIRGYIPEASEAFLSHRVLLAPLRFGAGLKGKLLESMYFGIPSVTTSVGSEGIAAANDWSGFTLTPGDHNLFVEKAVKLYSEPEDWKRAAIKGEEILEGRFLESGHLNRFLGRLEERRETLEAYRSSDIIGSILNTNHQLAYRYLSKYITLKNLQKN